ncbi:hypothetical protein DVB37_16425 [Achromobacter sp. B7]|nr:hypothetical protein DVB37_16425 [Achromobacter sp. B7]
MHEGIEVVEVGGVHIQTHVFENVTGFWTVVYYKDDAEGTEVFVTETATTEKKARTALSKALKAYVASL